MRLPLPLSLLVVLSASAPAHAAEEDLGPLPGALSISAFGGWVVYSAPSTGTAWKLMAWRDGKIQPVGVPDRGARFDVDLGPDEAGRPPAVYSRCRIAQLNGSRARLADSGFFSGTCGFRNPASPNVAGTDVIYGYAQGRECEEGSGSVRRFSHRTARRYEGKLPAGSSTAIARDRGVLYRVHDGRLLRTRSVAFRRIRGGEDRPPTF